MKVRYKFEKQSVALTITPALVVGLARELTTKWEKPRRFDVVGVYMSFIWLFFALHITIKRNETGREGARN